MYQNIYYDREENQIHLWDDNFSYEVFKYKRYAYIEDKDGAFITLSGKRVKRTGRWSKEDEEDGIVYESDIRPETRVLIDRYVDSDDVSDNHRIMVIDIEVSTENGNPDTNAAKNPITAISFYMSNTDKYTALILDTNNLLKSQTRDNIDIISVNTEEELLSRFIYLYTNNFPTILTGWNIDYFDIPYLFHRLLNVLGSEIACALSPIGIVEWLDYRKRYRIAGVSCLDYLSLYKKFTFSEEASYTLNAISLKELKLGKISYDGSLYKLFETDIEKFLEYNINDVRLVKMLDDKLKFIDLVKNICHKGHVPYEDVYFSSMFLEGAMLVYMKKLNMVAPTNQNRSTNQTVEKFEGAYVKPPIPGRYEWVYDLDMTSLYPSVIMTLNISPETKIGKIDGWDAVEFNRGVEKTYTLHSKNKKVTISTSELKSLFNESNVSISSNGVLYNCEKRGIIPAILETWFAERVEYRSLMTKYGDCGDKKMYEYFKARQHVQKILLNSLYGVLGLPVFRFYDLDNATAVTLTGQEIIHYSQKMANYYYNKELGTDTDNVIYVDTDSNYISALQIIKHRHPEINVNNHVVMATHVLNIATEVQEFINSSFDLFSKKFLNVSKHKFNIKQELVAKSALFLGKKRYALHVIMDNGVTTDKIDVKGIDTVRSDFPIAFRGLLKDLLKDILDNIDEKIISEKILTFKKNIRILEVGDISKPTSVKDIEKFKVSNERSKHTTTSNFGFKNYVKGTPAHVKASIMYNNLLTYYGLESKFSPIINGDKIKWVYMLPNEFGIDAIGYRGYDDPDEIVEFILKYVDHRRMFDSIFLNKLEDIYTALGWRLPTENEEVFGKFFEL